MTSFEMWTDKTLNVNEPVKARSAFVTCYERLNGTAIRREWADNLVSIYVRYVGVRNET